MYKRIFFLMGIVLSVGLLLGYGREVLAVQSQSAVLEIAGFENRAPAMVLTETLKLLPPEEAAIIRGHYGRSVLLNADTLFVGQAPVGVYPNPGTTPGEVFIYGRHAGGPNNWGLTGVITPSDSVPGNGDAFGSDLAISGDTLVVGAASGDGNADQTGTVYVFERNAGGPSNWGEVARLVASDGAYWDRFGWAVDIDGDTVVVGARWDDNGNGFDAGAAYVFERNAGGSNNWGQVRKLLASDGAASDWFGWDVAIAGDIIVIGANGQDTNGSNSGSFYVFERNAGGSNNWGQVAQIVPSPSGANHQFGIAVDLEGTRLAVGAIQASPNPGAVYLFDRDAGGTNNWGQIAHIVPSDGVGGDRFGLSLQLQANKLIVGAQYGDGVTTNSGSAYLFEQDQNNPGQWVEIQKLIASDGAADDQFGWGVTVLGETMAIGSFFNDDLCPTNPNCDSGSVYLYYPDLLVDVFIEKTVSAATAVPGQPLTYTLTFTNNGPDVAFGTVITDLVPGSIVNPTFTSSGVTITPTGSVPFVWQVAEMTPGMGGVITVTGIISPELLSETTIVNTAVISNSADITPTNNSSTAVTQVIIPQISLSAADYVVDEGAGQVMVTAVLSPPQPYLDVTVGYETSDGTAVSGEDYTAVTGILTFTAGVTEAQIFVPILEDQLVEPDETFSLELSDPAHATLGSIVTTTITILDDDTYPELNLSAAEYAVFENGGQVVLTVTLSHPYPESVSVAYETADGTAMAGEDYTAVSSILTFTAGITQAQILVPILDDQLVEGSETFAVALSSPVNAVLGGVPEAMVLIIDDDSFPLVSLSSDQYVVPEDVGVAVFTVTLSHDYPEPVSLTYETGDGTAVAGEDYVPVTGTLTFSPGETLATFTSPIIDDELVEPAETFSISLTGFINALPQPPVTAVVTILDNDEEPPVSDATIYLPLIMRPTPPASPVEFRVHIGDAIPNRPVVAQGEMFYTTVVQIPATLPEEGQFYLSTVPDQVTATAVDDQISFTLPNGDVIFSYRYSDQGEPFMPHIVPVPRALVAAMVGQTVLVRYTDVFGYFVSASTVWLIWTP